MAYLNEAERDELLDDLIQKTFKQAQRTVFRTDPQARLRLFRNVQKVNEWVTRYELPNRGAVITLIESRENEETDPDVRVKVKYELIRVEIAPTSDNRT